MADVTPPGHPGSLPRWTSSAKSGVGTAVNAQSRLWFTLSHGIVNEVYYPNIDQANTRDLGFLVSDGKDFFSEEKRNASHEILPIEQGVAGYRLINTCTESRYRITKTIITDPRREVLFQQINFEPLQGVLTDYHLYALLAPHIDDAGYGNNGWFAKHRGIPMLFAERNGIVLAMACSTPFLATSCGYVGTSDGWQDISQHKKMTWFYERAMDGNIALTAEIDLASSGGMFTLVLGFGMTADEAGGRARAGLLQNFDRVLERFVDEWRQFQSRCLPLGPSNHSKQSDHDKSDNKSEHSEQANEGGESQAAIDEKSSKAGFDLYRVSTAVLKTHESKRFPGSMIASLSIPWGEIKGDDELGGYHLIWPRDLCESADGMIAAGNIESARNTVFYLMCTQFEDGHWPQNMWQDGKPYWSGIQMDETALFILIADLLRRMNELTELDIWPSVRKAAGFLARNGPVTQQDRWEENPGYSTFTLATEIPALLAAADFADIAGEREAAVFLRQTADIWNDHIEDWTYVKNTDIARQVGVEGYYVRITPPESPDVATPTGNMVPIRNRPSGQDWALASRVVSPDALALVRFGLRAPHDPHIVNTVKVIDALLKTDTPTGPVWHRYNDDGYGEHKDGSPFDGTGIGRGWPLLAGERAHYELAAGNRQMAEYLLGVMSAQTSEGGLIPEQVWDAPDIPEKELYKGCPTHSAQPLVWAHAEYINLLRSLRDGTIFDLPPQPVKRYQEQKVTSAYALWRFMPEYRSNKLRALEAGKILRIEVHQPATIHWSGDNWQTAHDLQTQDSGLGIYYVDLPTQDLPAGARVIFTFYWPAPDKWEGTNFEIVIDEEL